MQIIHIYTIESPLAIIFRFFFYSNREISFSHEIRRTDCYAKLIFCLNNEFIVLMSRMENQIKHKNHFAITFAVFHSNKLKLFIKIWPIKENKLKIVYFVYTFLISAGATSMYEEIIFFFANYQFCLFCSILQNQFSLMWALSFVSVRALHPVGVMNSSIAIYIFE